MLQRDDHKVLFNFAFIPDEAARKDFADISISLAPFYEGAFYRLTAAGLGRDLHGHDSFPHVTLQHFWADPARLQDIRHVMKQVLNEAFTLNATQYALYRGKRRFAEINGSGLPATIARDDVYWLDILKDGALMQRRGEFQSHACSGLLPAELVAPDNMNYWPHLTIIAAPAVATAAPPWNMKIRGHGRSKASYGWVIPARTASCRAWLFSQSSSFGPRLMLCSAPRPF